MIFPEIETRSVKIPEVFRYGILAVTIMLSSCGAEQAANSQQDAVGDIFRSQGIVATLVVMSGKGEVAHLYNAARSKERFSPASTFKIPSMLIALDNHVVDSKDALFRWDGSDKGMARWNMDQTLDSAFKVSCVWCYQEIAREVGAERYQNALSQLSYGNQSVGKQVDLFWLNGDLAISAVEQVEFLRKLQGYELPFQHEHVDLLKGIMLIEKNAEYSMYAKTGWAATAPPVAWFVGFVETDTDTWFFAMNMRVDSDEQAALRKELTIRSLRILEII